MSCLIFSLLGLLFQIILHPSLTFGETTPTTPTDPAPSTAAPDPCASHTEIKDAWRNLAFTSTSYKAFPNNDRNSKKTKIWMRFIGIGGDRVVKKFPNFNVGGTNYPIYVPFTDPNINQTTVTGTAYAGSGISHPFDLEVMYCPGDIFLYKAELYPNTENPISFVTYHSSCTSMSCGPDAQCRSDGGCICVTGFEQPPDVEPTAESYGCTDIDECTTNGLCGNTEGLCINAPGAYTCECVVGYEPTNTTKPPSATNNCIDVDECSGPVCANGKCVNNVGSYTCVCNVGFQLDEDDVPLCEDIDECLDKELCGPDAYCTNTLGSFFCKCDIGYIPTNETLEPHRTNICIDLDECERFTIVVDKFKNTLQTLCGPYCNCTNTIGSYYCTCYHGFRLDHPSKMASVNNPCLDIDECVESPGICGKDTYCTNVPGTFHCSCPEKFYPNTGLEWIVGTTFCEYVQKRLNDMPDIKGKTKEGLFFDEVNHQLDNLTFVPVPTLANGIAACMEVAGVGPLAVRSRVSSSGDGAVGTDLLGLSDRLVEKMVTITYNQSNLVVKNSAVDLSLDTYGYAGNNAQTPPLTANGNTMQINMDNLAENNNGSAVVAFLTLNGMESVLSHNFLKTENRTEMLSDVITAVLPMMNNTNITDPVNFTIQHKRPMLEGSMVTCVYWKVERNDAGVITFMGWSTEGCVLTFSNENYTVCSCYHLSTFSLILQIAEPPEQNDFLEWLERICVIVGLCFFALAILTFLLCSWNPKVNNTARLHLCLNLGLSHLLMLWTDQYTNDKLACKVLAGLLHFLIVASFVWMQLEAVQLFMLVRKLTKVQVIKRDGLPKPLLYFVGYGVPMVIVGVSAVIFSDGYGATSGTCWLTTERNFNWALTGPVIFVLGLNCMLFVAILWNLRTTIANMRSGASDSKETRLVLFKIVAQFVILGCTWILGLYQTNLFFRVLFIILNSQQGTFLFIVHCVLNKEIREEYIKWLTCSFKKQENKDEDDKDLPSVSEDLDKTK